MRSLHVFAGPFPTSQGTQTLIGQTCRLMADTGHDVHLLTYAHGTESLHVNEETDYHRHRLKDFPRFRSERSGLHPAKALLDMSMAHRVASLVKSLKPNVIHAHHYEALLAATPASRLYKTPLVFHAHALMEPELGTYLPSVLLGPASRAGALLDRLGPSLANGTLALSGHMKETYVRLGANPKRIMVASPPGESVPSSFLSIDNDSPKSKSIRAVYSGNQDAYQGLSNLLDALSLLNESTRETFRFEFHVSGEISGLKNELSGRNLGFCSVHQLAGGENGAWGPIVNSDFVVIPRFSPGGVPIKLVNALVAGKPILADKKVAADLEHSEDAFLVDARDPQELFAGMRSLFNDDSLRKKLSVGAALAAERLHNPVKYVERINEIYTLACSSLQK